MRVARFLLVIGGLLALSPGVRAQETDLDSLDLQADSVSLDDQRQVGVDRPGDVAPPDTVVIDMVAPDHSPRKAALFSAVLPGLGQIYNGKPWKVPIIYGGFGILGYTIVLRNDQYQLFRRARIASQNNQPAANPLAGTDFDNENTLANNVDRTRQDRDQFIIYTAAWYALNIMDAIVDAHLIEFDVNPDLSLKLEPTTGPRLAYLNAPPSPSYAGVAFTVHFR